MNVDCGTLTSDSLPPAPKCARARVTAQAYCRNDPYGSRVPQPNVGFQSSPDDRATDRPGHLERFCSSQHVSKGS